MTDRVYPTKPNGTATATATANANHTAQPPLPNPPAKAHLYNPNRHPYRPTPTTRHHQKKTRNFSCRRCFCLSCFWSVLIFLIILLLAAIVAAAFYALYHPQRPLFSVTSLKISSFNLTTTPADDSTHLTTKINITLSAKNPNKKIVFAYGPMSIAVLSDSVILSNCSYSNFTNSPGTISIIHTTMAVKTQVLDADSLNSIKSDLKRKNGLPVHIVVDTTVSVKMDKMKTKKVGIRVRCDGIHGIVPKGKTVFPSKTTNAECTVDLRIKILKWTF